MYSIKAPQVKLNVNGYMYNYTCPAACCVIAMHSVRMLEWPASIFVILLRIQAYLLLCQTYRFQS